MMAAAVIQAFHEQPGKISNCLLLLHAPLAQHAIQLIQIASGCTHSADWTPTESIVLQTRYDGDQTIRCGLMTLTGRHSVH